MENSQVEPSYSALTRGVQHLTVGESVWMPEGVRGGNALKKTLIAVLAGTLLLSAAMPAFAKKHHKHHHHHHGTHSSQPAR
jgi:hypothetical protein